MIGEGLKRASIETDINLCGPSRNFSDFKTVEPQEILDYFEDKESVEVDTETEGFDPHTKKIITLQLGDKDRQFVIDVRSVNILLFKDLIESKLCLLQNAKFDYKVLMKNSIVLDKIYDTFLAENVIFNGFQERGTSLDALVKNYLGYEMEKETRGTFTSLHGEPLTERQIRYAGTDVAYLTRIKELQKRLIEKYDLWYAVDLANETVKSLADIEYNGMYLDKDEWMEIARQKQQELIKLELKMDRYLVDSEANYQPVYLGQDLFGEQTRVLDVNYGSPMQVKEMLNRLGMKVTSTDDRTLQKLKSDDFVQLLLEHRKLAKKVSTYGEAFLKYIKDGTGRIHTDFWQIKNTFRLGSGNKKQNAPNVQNIPSANEYRNCFKPREGYSWLSIDYSSQELRLMADFSGEDKFIDALNEGKDLHCFAYNTMTGANITKKDKEKRTKAKLINFGKPYGMSPYKLADTLDIPIEEAEELFELYARAFPSLNMQLEDQAEFGKKHGYIMLNPLHKGRRWFPEHKEMREHGQYMSWKEKNRLNGIIARASMNTPIQGTGAVIVKEAMVEIRKWLIEQGYWQDEVYMICQVHDQIDFEVRDDLVDDIKHKLENIMIEVGNKYVTRVSMDVDSTITKQWQK